MRESWKSGDRLDGWMARNFWWDHKNNRPFQKLTKITNNRSFYNLNQDTSWDCIFISKAHLYRNILFHLWLYLLLAIFGGYSKKHGSLLRLIFYSSVPWSLYNITLMSRTHIKWNAYKTRSSSFSLASEFWFKSLLKRLFVTWRNNLGQESHNYSYSSLRHVNFY